MLSDEQIAEVFEDVTDEGMQNLIANVKRTALAKAEAALEKLLMQQLCDIGERLAVVEKNVGGTKVTLKKWPSL